MGYRLLADGVAGIHYGYLAYLVSGGFIAWRWPRTIVTHVLAAAWGVVVVAASWLGLVLRRRRRATCA